MNIRTNTSHFPLIITWQRTHRISSLTSTHVETLKNGTYNTTTATLSIQWPNFHVSQAGSYTCLAQLQSNEQAIVTKEVIVQGNYCICAHYNSLCSYTYRLNLTYIYMKFLHVLK